ncbi:solute carrier family 10 (sodium/bile acid cotransporter), member 7 [Cyclobacterium lianum]|uniref:Solute carrier family 10 (Sodium/bile acid cotransporter), member 7 n=1 Tax=Cyclobacterium lianum TaxID=388280 RepID=A0A1M7QFE9_9BACT|nr:bile acid:sodium symporter family protein [Cyclobacterium lianum]SHN29742.1 solute carrier family 10 (sodium/bile acid cotransporter), member 7 [Cyclobacterium lianum]
MAAIKDRLAKAGINSFFFLLLLTICLAYLFPEWGQTKAAGLSLDDLTYYGVSLIFFFYGVKISPATLKTGLSNWKLHLLIQSTTFLIFPLIILALYAVFGNQQNLFWLGTFYLAALPSTVSSSVVMVSIAGGNLPAAIFNASISSIIGILITPLWMGLLLSSSQGEFELLSTVWKLVQQIFIPVLIGFWMHRWLSTWVQRYSKVLKSFDQAVILLIVFSAFSESFGADMFAGQNILGLGLLMLLLFVFMLAVMYFIGKGLRFGRADRITVLFCGSKKSLVQGAVMGKILFPDPLVFGVVLLPLMLYHTLQLILGAALAEKLAAETK